MTSSRLASRGRAARRLAIAAAAMLACAAPAFGQDYPRLGLLGQMHSSGYPLWDQNGTLDPQMLDDIARFHEVILDASPITEYRPDAIAALRQRRPDIKMLAYVTGHHIWNFVPPDSFVNFPARYWRMIRDMDGFLYNTQGGQYGVTTKAFANVNIAKRDASGTYVVAEALAQLFYNAIISKNLWDGLFIDTYCTSISWSQTPSEMIDYQRAGYTSIQAFDAGWAAGTDTLASRLRQLAGPTEILVGNCIPGTKFAWFNGWMAENFPFQNGGTWDDNMYRDPGGYFADELAYLPPRRNHLYTYASDPSQPYSADNTRRVRLGLGSAALREGYGMFGEGSRNDLIYLYERWWYDEYAVDRSTGRASTLQKDTGWLGQPLAAATKTIWVTNGLDAVTNSGFETDVSGWTSGSQTNPSSFVQDRTTAAVGSASAKFSLSAPEAVTWAAGIGTVGTLNLNWGSYYSATFWAKASSPRKIVVVASAPGGGDLALGTVDLTTSWQQYQVVFYPTASGTSHLQFHLGATAGDTWFDDVHFQAGFSSIYRRDFQHGIILVNPTLVNLTVPLERSYYRIRGIADPTTNDGSSGSQITVRAMDALFLLGSDQVKPAAVLDLHIKH